MSKQISLFLITLILLILFSLRSYGADNIINLEIAANYSSEDYQKLAISIASNYPEIVRYELIGFSHDEKPIYSLILSGNINEIYPQENFKILRKHFLIDAGIHGRETINTAITLKMIEDYAIDYYNDSHIPSFDTSELLQKTSLHFIPLLNPDGHDLSKFGISSIRSRTLVKTLNTLKDKFYSNWKSNALGVDINRNFPDFYFDNEKLSWVSKWKKFPNKFISNVPSGSYYHGEPASEPETKALIEYIDKYDFRSYISFHSRGKVLYYTYYWDPKSVQDESTKMATLIQRITGYKMMPGNHQGSGYSTEYFVSKTLKPAVTVETLHYGAKMPAAQKYYLPSYKETYLVPLSIAKTQHQNPYGLYKLYSKQGLYIRDYEDYQYAKVHSDLISGIILSYEGTPIINTNYILNRENALTDLLKNVTDISSLTVDESDSFKDTNNVIATFAKNNNIASSDMFGNFNPNHFISPFEYATFKYNIDMHFDLIKSDKYKDYHISFEAPIRCKDAVRYVLYSKFMKEDDFYKEYVLYTNED